MRIIAALALAACVAGCATVSYLSSEYGSAEKDGDVLMPDGSQYLVWMHKTKPKVVLTVSIDRAANMGLARGLTFGAVGDKIPQPVWEEAARRWFEQSGRPECRTTRGYQIDEKSTTFEFDYECARPPAPSPVARTPAKKR